jgi:hypothetical protein
LRSIRVDVRALAAALVLAAGTLAGCGGGGGSESGERALVIGDSIFQLSRDQLTQALEHDGWQPTVEAAGGSTIAQWAQRAGDLARVVRPKIAVVELGTNQKGDTAAVPGVASDLIKTSRPQDLETT